MRHRQDPVVRRGGVRMIPLVRGAVDVHPRAVAVLDGPRGALAAFPRDDVRLAEPLAVALDLAREVLLNGGLHVKRREVGAWGSLPLPSAGI